MIDKEEFSVEVSIPTGKWPWWKSKKATKRSSTPGLNASSSILSPNMSSMTSNNSLSIQNSRLTRRMNSLIESQLKIVNQKPNSSKKKSAPKVAKKDKKEAKLPNSWPKSISKYQIPVSASMMPKDFHFYKKTEMLNLCDDQGKITY